MVIPWSWSCQDLTTVTMFHSMIILWSIMFHSMNIIWRSCFGEKCRTWQPPVNKVYRNRLPRSLFCIFKEALSSWDTAYHTWRDPRRERGLHGSQKNWKKIIMKYWLSSFTRSRSLQESMKAYKPNVSVTLFAPLWQNDSWMRADFQ